MGKRCKAAQSDCGRDYSQGIDLCLNEGDEIVECDLIIICESAFQVAKVVILLQKILKGGRSDG